MANKKPLDEVRELHANNRKEALRNHALVQTVKGLWLFAEGAALLICSLFSAHEGWYGDYPTWGRDTLLVAAALVLVPAAFVLAKFFRNVGRVE